MKKKKQNAKPSQLSWEKVRELPVGIFHTAGGPPIIGHVGTRNKAGVVLWAPAHVTMPGPTSVIYLPVPFVDKYIELLWSGVRGTHPIDPIITQGYAGFFEQFIVDAYRMRPILMGASIDTPEGAHEQKLPEGKEKEKKLEPCPACKQDLSAWNAHHPVLLPANDGAEPTWTCEVDMPDIRERYPNENPPRPLHN